MVTLAEARAHLRLTVVVGDSILELEEYTEVEKMIGAAKSHLESIDVDMTADPLPPALHHAVLMLVAHFYTFRGAASDTQMYVTPLGVTRLIAPYRRISL